MTPGKPSPLPSPHISGFPPSSSGLFATPNGKAPMNGNSPGGWSTVATPGGLDDLLKRNATAPGASTPLQPPHLAHDNTASPTPARIGDLSKKVDDAPGHYPPRPYPAVNFNQRPQLPPKPLPKEEEESIDRNGGNNTDEDDDGWSTAPQGWGEVTCRGSKAGLPPLQLGELLAGKLVMLDLMVLKMATQEPDLM